MSQGTVQPVYRPDMFDVPNMERARKIVVTAEEGTTSDERWVKETDYLINDIGQRLPLRPDSCVLDYGCGPGRLSKALIDKFGCRVVGVDFSQSMRLLAPEYVVSERFNIWSPEVLAKLVAKGFRADFAVSVWVLQHVLDPMDVMRRMSATLKPGGLLYSLNQVARCVPTDRGWFNDGINVRAGLGQVFQELSLHSLPLEVTTPLLAATSMIQVLRKRD
jgi:SAM-dependent methyltransferase